MSERRTTRGGRGGGAPRQPQCSTLRVLACHHNSGKPATRGTRKNVLPGIARNGLDRAVAGKLLGLLKDGEGRRPPTSFRRTAALSCAARVLPYPVPLGDPRPSILGDSTAP